jgi:hypothetical protein
MQTKLLCFYLLGQPASPSLFLLLEDTDLVVLRYVLSTVVVQHKRMLALPFSLQFTHAYYVYQQYSLYICCALYTM